MMQGTAEECRWSSAVDGAAFGVWDFDVRQDRVHYSPQWKARLGFPRIDAPDSSAFWRCRVHPDDVLPMMETLRDHIDGSSPTYEMRFRLRSNGAGYRPMLSRGRVAARDESGQATRIVGTMLDLNGRPQVVRGYGLIVEEAAAARVRAPALPFHALLAVSDPGADRRQHGAAASPQDRSPASLTGSDERRRLTDLVGDLLDTALRESRA